MSSVASNAALAPRQSLPDAQVWLRQAPPSETRVRNQWWLTKEGWIQITLHLLLYFPGGGAVAAAAK